MMVSVWDFYLACIAPIWSISFHQFRQTLVKVHTATTSPFRQAPPADLRVIKKHSARVGARTTSMVLCSLKLVHRALCRLQALTPQLTAEFQLLFERSCHLQRLSVHQLDPNQQAMLVRKRSCIVVTAH
jgi:hypothetical protein